MYQNMKSKHFKPGDKIICIDNFGVEDELELNKIYTLKYLTRSWSGVYTTYGVKI